MDVKKIISEYDDLVARALAIVKAAPMHGYVEQEDYARLGINDQGVYLFWPETERDYGYDRIVMRNSNCFDPALLLLSPEEFEKWKAEEKRIYDERLKAEAKQKAAQNALDRERRERETLAALKAKYEK
jgi:hypothetical protein